MGGAVDSLTGLKSLADIVREKGSLGLISEECASVAILSLRNGGRCRMEKPYLATVVPVTRWPGAVMAFEREEEAPSLFRHPGCPTHPRAPSPVALRARVPTHAFDYEHSRCSYPSH